MWEFLLLLVSISIIMMCTKSVFTSSNKIYKNQLKFLKLCEEIQKEGLSEQVLETIFYAVNVVVVIYYLFFYITSAVIVNNNFYTLIAAALSVEACRSCVKTKQIIETKQPIKLTIFNKFSQVVGLLYSLYFVYFYITTTFTTYEISDLVIGVIIGSTIVLGIRYLKKVLKNR